MKCPSILCCLYTQFSMIKNFQERMQNYALMLPIVWKIGFFKQFTDIWDFSYLNRKFLWVFMVHPLYVAFIHNLVHSKFPVILWKVMLLLCVMREKWIFKKILSFLVIFISKPSNFKSLDSPLILCCLYTQFRLIKKFQERMQSYALMLLIVWKNVISRIAHNKCITFHKL